jgi:hypothetical protein
MPDKSRPLVTASRVRGVPVFNRAGIRIGHVEDLSIEKASGKVRYALMSFGGFLGMGDKLYPLAWEALTYSVEDGGFIAEMSDEALGQAPSYDRAELEAYGGQHELHPHAATYHGPACSG